MFFFFVYHKDYKFKNKASKRMSVILRKSWFFALALIVGSFFLTNAVFAVDYLNIEEVNAVIDYKDGYIEVELEDSDGESGFYQLWGTTDEQDVYDDVAEKMGVDDDEVDDLVDFTFEHVNRGDEGGFPFSIVGSITLQPADKTGYVQAVVKYDRAGVLSIIMDYDEAKLLEDYYEEITNELSDAHNVTGTFDADDVEDLTEVNIDLAEYGEQLDKLVANHAQSELCEEFTPGDIYEVEVEAFDWYEDENQKDKVTIKWSGGCDYYFKTNARASVTDFWKGYLVQEIVAKINNTQYRISPAVEYDDIADVIVFKGNYPTDTVPTLAQLQAEKDGQVETPEQETNDNALRAQLMRLIEMLQQLLQLQSLLGR